MYVLQRRFREWESWETLPCEYSSLDEAKTAVKNMPSIMMPHHRIAEVYYVKRYKAVGKNDLR